MSFLWESMKQTAQMATSAAMTQGAKAKCKADILLIDRDMKTRKQNFGIQLYDFVEPLASRPDFFAANDKLTNTIRGPFLGAQREIAALNIKRRVIKENMAQAEVTRKAAFPTQAQTAVEKIQNAGKSAAFAGNEAKLAAELSMNDIQAKHFKQEFGLVMYATFKNMEDHEGWLPTVREIRAMYDSARQDMEKLQQKRLAKEREIVELSGGTIDSNSNGTSSLAVPAPPAPAPALGPTTSGPYGATAAAATAYPVAQPAATPVYSSGPVGGGSAGPTGSASIAVGGGSAGPTGSASLAPVAAAPAQGLPSSVVNAFATPAPAPVPVPAPVAPAYNDPFAASQPQPPPAQQQAYNDPFANQPPQQPVQAVNPMFGGIPGIASPTPAPAAEDDPFAAFAPAPAPAMPKYQDPFAATKTQPAASNTQSWNSGAPASTTTTTTGTSTDWML